MTSLLGDFQWALEVTSLLGDFQWELEVTSLVKRNQTVT